MLCADKNVDIEKSWLRGDIKWLALYVSANDFIKNIGMKSSCCQGCMCAGDRKGKIKF